MSESEINLAIEEIKLAQDLINTQENLHFKVFSWAIGVITALTIGFFHNNIDMHPAVYMTLGITVILIFNWVAKRHWNLFYCAAARSYDIELEVENDNYSGIKLNRSLNAHEKDIELKHRMRLYAPYLALSVVVLLSGLPKLLSCWKIL